MNDENGDEKTNRESAKKDASPADSTDREDTDGVPEYEGQWAALSDGKSDGNSDGSGGSGKDDTADE